MKNISITLMITLILLSSCSHQNKYYDPYKSHHEKEGFRNITLAERVKKRGVMHWLADVFFADAGGAVPTHTVESVPPDLQKIYHPKTDLQVTWIGHASFLVQIGGMNILTDPIFSKRASPLQFIGPERKIAPGINFKDLPPIDIVLISHNHYDHMDLPTIQKFGNSVLYLVPLGEKEWFTNIGIHNVKEMDWWDTAKITGGRFTFVPGQHFSGRLVWDLNNTLWGGWTVEKNGKKLYFAGDTGYAPLFKEIGARIGPFDISLIPIGAYDPQDVLQFAHINPYEAVKVHQDVKSKQSIAMHWGTFRLTTEPMQEPPLLLQDALAEKHIDKKKFITLKIGETFVVK